MDKSTKKNPLQRDRPKQFIALARVSSRAQENEGTSLEVQEQALHAHAAKEGGEIVRLWKIAETASKAERRTSFKELLAYAKANADKLDGLLVYKLDRAARNMTDYGQLVELEVVHGVPLLATSQPTQNTPAGRMARNMMAAMGTFFAEQLSVDVKQGLAQRVRDGYFPTVPPYGYCTERINSRSIVKIESREAENVKRIFDLYAYHHCTIDMVLAKLKGEGRTYSAKQPHWVRSKIHRILRDRSYIGDLKYHGHWQAGRHPPIVDRQTFARVQSLLGEKVYKAHELTYAGELITCGHCGRPITGEIVLKKSSGKEYVYYRCSRYTQPDHPRVRLREQQIDQHILAMFATLVQPAPVQAWFRQALIASSTHQQEQSRARSADIQRQLDDVRRQQERLLNLHLSGGIDESAFAGKNVELRDRIGTLTLELESTDRNRHEKVDHALRVFELDAQRRNARHINEKAIQLPR